MQQTIFIRYIIIGCLLFLFGSQSFSATNYSQNNKPIIEFESSAGFFVIQLNCRDIPNTCNNFLTYVSDGFYDNTLIHRVIKDYIIQMGGYTNEFQAKAARKSIQQEKSTQTLHTKWSVGMALAMNSNSARSQFFINMKDNPEFNFPQNPSIKQKGYTVIGKVISGHEVINAINESRTDPYRYFSQFYNRYITFNNVPVKRIIIKHARILRNTTNPKNNPN